MLRLEAECPSKQNILIADTIFAESGPLSGFRVWGERYICMGERFLFSSYVSKTFF